MTFAWIIGTSLAGSIGCVLLAAIVLVVPPRLVNQSIPRLVCFSTGTLLGTAFLGLLPNALNSIPYAIVGPVLVAGIMTFYLLEKLLVWRHCHRQSCDVHVGTGPLLLIGDSFHNFVDGIVITSAYLTSFPLGISVTLSTVAHEVPQEIGEFLVYLKSGYRRRQALLLNSISSLTTLLGATLGYVFLSQLRSFSPYLVVFAASGFIYVALADLIPTQRQTSTLAITLLDGLLIVLGITVVGLLSHHH